MPEISVYFGNAFIDHMLRNQNFTPPSSIYVGLFTTAPDATGSNGVEVTGGGYARQPITLAAAANRSTSNSVDVGFPTATADWGSIVGFGIFDAQTGGSLLIFSPLDVTKSVVTGDQPHFPIGDLSVSIQ